MRLLQIPIVKASWMKGFGVERLKMVEGLRQGLVV